ncbi:MAG: sensor histidine kinase [Eubacteriaceae bacterium]
MNQHAYKNQLIILQGFLETKKYKDANDYLTYISHTEKNISNLDLFGSLPIGEFRGFINLKFSDLIHSGITVDVIIEKNIPFLNEDDLGEILYYDLCNIIGVFVDNAKESCEISEYKEILMEIYTKDNTCYISLTNTFSIAPDLSLIKIYGYSTKGKNRGYGLYIVQKIIRHHQNLNWETTCDEKFFTQTICLKMGKKY